jgi:HK97 family phage prohead protease
MDYLYAPFELKSDDGSDGTIYGYGSVFGNIDSYGDTVAPGAFKKTIADVMTGATPWPAMLLQHGGMTSEDATPIGIWTEMSEDDKGLRLTGKLAIKNRRGAEAYALLKMKPRPALNGLSIGYRAKDFELHKSGPVKRTLKAVDLVECSLVTFPADKFARVIGVKAYSEPAPEPVVVDWKAHAMDDYLRLAREMTKHNRNWR